MPPESFTAPRPTLHRVALPSLTINKLRQRATGTRNGGFRRRSQAGGVRLRHVPVVSGDECLQNHNLGPNSTLFFVLPLWFDLILRLIPSPDTAVVYVSGTMYVCRQLSLQPLVFEALRVAAQRRVSSGLFPGEQVQADGEASEMSRWQIISQPENYCCDCVYVSI